MEKLIESVKQKLANKPRHAPFLLELSRSDLKEAYYSPSTYALREIGRGYFFRILFLPNITHNLQMQDCFIFHPLDGLPSGQSIKLPTIIAETSGNKAMLRLTEEVIPIKKAHARVYVDPDVRRMLDEDFCIAYAALASWTLAEKEVHRQVVEELMQVSRRPELRVELPEKSLPQPSIVSLIGYLSESSRADLDRREIQKVPLSFDIRDSHRYEKTCILLSQDRQASIGLVKTRDPNPKLIDRILEPCILLPYELTSDYAPMISFWPSSLYFFIREDFMFDFQIDHLNDEAYVKCTIYYGFYFEENDMKVIPDIPEAIRKLAC